VLSVDEMVMTGPQGTTVGRRCGARDLRSVVKDDRKGLGRGGTRLGFGGAVLKARKGGKDILAVEGATGLEKSLGEDTW